MIVSHTWLAEHINDPNIVILDSRGNVHILTQTYLILNHLELKKL